MKNTDITTEESCVNCSAHMNYFPMSEKWICSMHCQAEPGAWNSVKITPPPEDATWERGDENKFDKGKPPWDLIPLSAVEEIVKVLGHGANKHGPESWKKVDKDRYFAATLRHLSKWQAGEKIDKDSGLTQLSHAATNMVFLIWLEENDDEH